MKALKRFLTVLLAMTAAMGMTTAQAQTVVLTEDFSGDTNIFGASAVTSIMAGTPSVYDSKLTGFGPVLAVCNTTAEGTISVAGQPVAIDGKVTAEWDALHGYYGYSKNTTVSLLNSDGESLASYTYNVKDCKVTKVTIGGQDVAGFEAFGLKQGNGFGGGNSPYTATGNPHIAVTITAQGSVTMLFSKGATEVKTVYGSVGSLKKDIATMKIVSNVENTDRCYAVDNIQVSTEELEEDPNYVEPLISATIVGPQRMTFGPSTAEACQNAYSVTLVGAGGTVITEDNISEKVTDFKVVWDIEGFKTANDTEGQYCDSYGAFSVNGEGRVATTFDLRDVPMNFFGRLTATVTYNGSTLTAGQYVVAQGDLSKPDNQVLPLAGYPVSISSYPDALVGYQMVSETYGADSDLLLGGWCVAGSDGGKKAVLSADGDGSKYIRFSSSATSKSHVMTKTISAPTGQVIFALRLRFNHAGGVVTLTSGYPFWSASKYACPVTFNFNGTALKLNGTTLTKDDAEAAFTTATWYDVVLSVDKSSERCYALVCDTDGQLLGESGIVAWAESANPTYFNIGMGNSNIGSVDMASYEAYVPAVDADSYVLQADKTTLSIPEHEQARLTATISDTHGYSITQLATWSVAEEDMQQSVVITPDAADSHQATVTLAPTAEAGTATIQVSIGGNTRTLPLSLTTSAESIKFTQSATSVTIPMDEGETATVRFEAVIIDGAGNDTHSTVTLALYDKDNMQPFAGADGITFDAQTGELSVTSQAAPMQLTVRATGLNSQNEELSKSVRVNIHGMKFDFGFADDEAVAEGFTLVGAQTAYNVVSGYGIKSGTPEAGGTASATDATTDYLEGAIEFDFNVRKGEFYLVEITYQGLLTTGYINSDLAGYKLGESETMTTVTYTVPATTEVIDLRIADNGDVKARIAQVSITKQAKRQKRGKRVVHHIGDSTSANNGSWAYRLNHNMDSYPELSALCDFHNDGAGGRNLSTYYTQGKLASVLRDIYPGDVVMFGNNGTNGMGSSFEDDVNYYLDAAEALGAKIILNSYTPHGAVSSYAGYYNAETNTFESYRRDSYETVVRRIAAERAQNDADYLGFVEIGKNADDIFNAYVQDYAANGYDSADAAAQAIIACFSDHNHYSNSALACKLMLDGYSTTATPGIVSQMVTLLSEPLPTAVSQPAAHRMQPQGTAVYNLSGQRVDVSKLSGQRGIFIVGGKKVMMK